MLRRQESKRLNGRGGIAAITCALLALVACGGSSPSTSNTPASVSTSIDTPVTLTAMFPSNYVVPFKVVTDDFTKANPNVRFNVQPLASASIPQLMTTQLRAGNAADILFFNAGRGNTLGVLNFAASGYLVDLAGRPFQKLLIPQQLQGVQDGKHLWAAPTQILTIGLVYNTDMFTQLGVTTPDTFSSLLTACKKIAAAGKVPIAYPAGDNLISIFLVYSLIANDVYAQDPTWNDKRAAGTVKFATSAGWKNAYQQILDMKNANCFSPGAAGLNGANAQAQFAAGSAAMYPNGTQIFAALKAANPNLHFAIFALPADKSTDTRVMLSSSALFGVNAATSGVKRQAALKFIDFLASPDENAAFNAAGGATLTGYQYSHSQLPTDWSTQLAPVTPLFKRQNPLVPSAVWPNAQVQLTAATDVAGLFTGQKTVDQTLADLDAAFNQGTGG
jgi:raffinose/stachyose/melibiose transport system substrate-binding protein